MHHHSIYAKTTPDKPALIMSGSGEVRTWKEFSGQVNRIAQYFKAIGLKEKDHIAIMMENNPHYLEIVNAATDAGLIYTCISTSLKVSETEYILENSNALLLITSSQMRDLASKILDKSPGIRHRLMVGGIEEGYESYERTVEQYPAEEIPYGNSGYAMLYSSGTTGRPKGIIATIKEYPVGTMREIELLLCALFEIDSSSKYISPAPLYHSSPLHFCRMVLNSGGTCIIMERFDAEESLTSIEKYQVTHSQWVPTMFIRMLKLPEKTRTRYDLSSHKYAIHGAAPIPVPVKEKMIKWWGPIIYEGYGGTEETVATMITSEEWMTHKGSVGQCHIGRIHILDEEGNELPPYKPGQIYVENGKPFEYYNEPEKNRESKNKNGWTTIGDIGYLDEEGYLYLTDRKSHMIISGGVNVYPQEVENFLAVHPKVEDVAVIGIPHEEFGEEVKAVVIPENQNEAGPELERELLEYCRSDLSSIKCPKSIDFVEHLPRTPTGKLIKRILKEQYSKSNS